MNLFTTYRPSKSLQDIVEIYWRSQCDLSEPIVQDLCTPTLQALTFNLGGLYEDVQIESDVLHLQKDSYIFGQSLSKRISISNPQGINILGIKFTPTGLYLLTGIHMLSISDQIIDANEIWYREINTLQDEILQQKNFAQQVAVIENFLTSKRKLNFIDDRLKKTNYAVKQMENNQLISIRDLREDCFLTKKSFERYFLNFIGVTPKQYSNICRFNQIVSLLKSSNKEPNWYSLIIKYGYHDHSHFIREFKRYSGKTPIEFYKNTAPQFTNNLDQIVSFIQE